MSQFWVRLFLATVMAFGSDWLTKEWALAVLVPFQPVSVVGEIIRLTLGYNTGVAFGALAGSSAWALLLSGGVLLAVVVWLIRSALFGSPPLVLAVPLGLLLGGGAANLLDRLPDGRVTDFIDVGIGSLRWPTFNIADACIMLAVASCLWASMKHSRANEASS